MKGNGVTTRAEQTLADAGMVGRGSSAEPWHPLRILVLARPDLDLPGGSQGPEAGSLLVEKTADLPRALRMLAASRFDVVLLDGSLPESGNAEAVRAVYEAASPPVAVVSSRPIAGQPPRKSIEIGGQHFYLKGEVAEALLLGAIIYSQSTLQVHNELLTCKLDLQRSNRELESAHLQLIQSEKLEALGQLAAGVAHEVKNPLARILLGIEYLTRADLSRDDKVPEVLRSIRTAARRADGIIRGMVDLSSMSKLLLKIGDLNSVVREAALLVQHELILHSIDLQLDLHTSLPPARIDAAKIEQVLLNLYLNAIHAMAESPSRRLRVSTAEEHFGDHLQHPAPESAAPGFRRGDPILVIRVEDEGCGLPESGEVFEPFFSTKPPGKGTGLGLTVCRKIIDLHHGLITLRNRPETGAVATIALPAAELSPP